MYAMKAGCNLAAQQALGTLGVEVALQAAQQPQPRLRGHGLGVVGAQLLVARRSGLAGLRRLDARLVRVEGVEAVRHGVVVAACGTMTTAQDLRNKRNLNRQAALRRRRL